MEESVKKARWLFFVILIIVVGFSTYDASIKHYLVFSIQLVIGILFLLYYARKGKLID